MSHTFALMSHVHVCKSCIDPSCLQLILLRKALGGCVTSQGVADSVDLDKHDNVAGEIQASMQVAADARQLIMETVIHLQVTLRQLSCAHAVLLSTAA